jgi:hypothetical protein
MTSRQPACIYFAGLAQHQHCEWLKGLPALESFANKRKLMLPYRATFSTMALEGGVISNLHAKRKGRTPVVHFRPYLDFAQQHGRFYAWVASFDVIDGGPRVNLRYWQTMRDAGVARLLPVFHQGEPWSLLVKCLPLRELMKLVARKHERLPRLQLFRGLSVHDPSAATPGRSPMRHSAA